MTSLLRFLFLGTLLLFKLRSSDAQTPFPLADPTHQYRMDTHVSVFIDSSAAHSFEEIRQPSFQHRFQIHTSSLTFGYLKPPLWLRVQTKSSSPDTEWYLSIPAPFIEYVDFYQLQNNTWTHAMSGYYRKHAVRIISHTGHVLPLVFGKDSISTVYIQITGASPKTFPLYAIEKERFNQQARREDVGYGIFFGILIVMFFYNLLLGISLKQSNYYLYVCTIVCTFFVFASASGYGGKFLWPDSPLMNYYAGRMSLGVMIIFLAFFSIRFLEVRKYSRIMYYLLLSLIPLAVIATLLMVLKIMSSAGNNLISIATIMFMITGFVCRIRGNKTATYFIAAWTIYLIGGLLLTLRNSGVFDFNFWTTHFVEVGAALETTIIAFALGDRYRRYKQEKEEAQALALKIQQEATEKLEVQVQLRTEQLSRAYEELRATHETNTLQTRIIENKNAELDAFFYRISHDLRGPISSLLGLAFLAKQDVKDKNALEYIDRQQTQVERLNNIILGLINLTKLSHTDMQKEPIDFTKMIDDCIASLNTLPNVNNIIFSKDIQRDIEFYSEWILVNAILQNLIENAIKYSRNESPYVNISVSSQKDFVTIKVEDNGQGIPQEHQQRIFEMFFRATQQANGTGLGLYILKRSVDRLKGSIELKSEYGMGSCFEIRLPV